MNPQSLSIFIIILACVTVGTVLVASLLDVQKQRDKAQEAARQQALQASDRVKGVEVALASAMESRDNWKENANKWREMYVEQRDRTASVLDAYMALHRDDSPLPRVQDSPIPDPPTVGDADRAIVEAGKKTRDRKRRPLDSGHVPLSTDDPERRPVHRARDSEAL